MLTTFLLSAPFLSKRGNLPPLIGPNPNHYCFASVINRRLSLGDSPRSPKPMYEWCSLYLGLSQEEGLL
jgi:hypothetical protein